MILKSAATCEALLGDSGELPIPTREGQVRRASANMDRLATDLEHAKRLVEEWGKAKPNKTA